MKDKASADTQRTEAVNCMLEITGGERRGGQREMKEDSNRQREETLGQIRGGEMKRRGNRRLIHSVTILHRLQCRENIFPFHPSGDIFFVWNN